MKEFRFILLILTLGILSSGCVKEDAVPDLPPSGSMIMEIDNIWKDSPSPGTYPSGSPQANFVFAATNVYVWNAVLTIQMAVPVAAFLESFNHTPEWDKSTSSWVWSYTVDLPNTSYTAELFGESKTDEIHWSMYISKTDGFTDFLWFTGISAMDNKSGSWIINMDPDDNLKDPEIGLPFISIQWSKTGDDIAEISYTNIEEESVNNGSYIKYGLTGDSDLNAFYDIYRIWENNTVNIKWNTSTHFGRVLSMAHFQDPYWHCWTETFANIVCE